MSDYKLRKDADGRVGYVYKNDGTHPVYGKTKLEAAKWMLGRGTARMSDEFEGFPLTSDGMYFFEIEENSLSQALPDSSLGEGACGDDGVEIGADGLPIPAGDGGKRRRKRRVKDIVCE